MNVERMFEIIFEYLVYATLILVFSSVIFLLFVGFANIRYNYVDCKYSGASNLYCYAHMLDKPYKGWNDATTN